jgi:hypothetical protein
MTYRMLEEWLHCEGLRPEQQQNAESKGPLKREKMLLS